MSTLHEHLPTDILPAELGGTGPAFNPGLWAEPVIHSAMKEAELAAIKKDKEQAENAGRSPDKKLVESRNAENNKRNEVNSVESSNAMNRENGRRFFNPFGGSARSQSIKKAAVTNVELNLINRGIVHVDGRKVGRGESRTIKEDDDTYCQSKDKMLNNGSGDYFDDKREAYKDLEDSLLTFRSEVNSNEYGVSNRPDSDDSKDNSLDRSENALIESGKCETPSEETNLIT